MNIIGKSKIFLSVSAILIIASIAAVVLFGFKSGIDFKGGTLWQLKSPDGNQEQTINDLKKFFQTDLKIENIAVFPGENNSYLVRTDNISEEDHQKFLGELKSKFNEIEELKFESIGPAVGNELKQKAIWAIVWVLLGISLYVAYAFRKVSHPVTSWKYGIITLFTLFHDVIVPAGLLAVLGWKLGVEIDTNFIVALLVIMGFSVHDTIVVFDRIRENLMTSKSGSDFSEIVNKSVNQTLARSINTSVTVFIVLLAMFFFGPESIKYFILTILVGVAIGTYSSIFVASPLLVMWGKGKK